MNEEQIVSGGLDPRPPGLFTGPAPYIIATPWRPLGGTAAAIGIFAGAALAVAVAVIAVWLVIGGDFKAIGDDVRVQLGATLVQQAVMVGLTLWAASRYSGVISGVLALRRPAQGYHIYAAAFFVFLAAMVVMSQLSNLASPQAGQADIAMFKAMFASPLWPLALFVVGVGAPIAEELLFRGFLFPALANSKLGLTGAAVTTSAIFAAVHPYSVTGRLEVFAIGMLLAWLLVRTGSLRVTMFAHSLNNTIQAVLILVGADSWL